MSQIGTHIRASVHNWDHAPAAFTKDGKPMIVGAQREYRREDYMFARTQSPATQSCEWERVQPLRTWGMNALADLALKIFG